MWMTTTSNFGLQICWGLSRIESLSKFFVIAPLWWVLTCFNHRFQADYDLPWPSDMQALKRWQARHQTLAIKPLHLPEVCSSVSSTTMRPFFSSSEAQDLQELQSASIPGQRFCHRFDCWGICVYNYFF